ncbi:MAG: T9SS type A sorting domain-containing protein [Bacteroidetes bacterium]|nr:MAG: T9SS type A sorting domain-containing protein [Bacteroidota bacterium]
MPRPSFASNSKNMKLTKLWMTGAFASLALAASAQTVTVTDASINANDSVYWSNNNTYIISEPVFVEDGARLYIQAGTVIKGKAGVDAFLTISRGGKIYAEGRSDAPIIFTAEADDVNDPNDLGPADIGLWGGLVICGKAPIERDGLLELQAEGVAGTEPRALYGGNDDNDNSGVLRYVSVRHAGFELGSGDELNGISFCGVGSGTTVEYVEVYANKDDGIEFFGGSVNVKYAIVAFCRDDAFDWDEGYRGKGQFWFAIQSTGLGDCIGELDGAIPDGGARYSNPMVYNWTGIGPGSDTAVAKAAQTIMILMRDATAGTIANSIFTQGRGWALQIEDLTDAKGVDAFQRLQDGDLNWKSNLVYDFFRGNTLDTNSAGLLNINSGAQDASLVRNTLIKHFNDSNNKIADPGISPVSRIQDGGLDPRPASNADVTSNLAAIPNDPFFTQVSYKGAFDPNGPTWANGWTTLARNGHFHSTVTSVKPVANVNGVTVYPNPANNAATVAFNLVNADNITVNVMNISGQVISNNAMGNLTAGSQELNLDLAGLKPGVYFVTINGNNGAQSLKLIVQ